MARVKFTPADVAAAARMGRPRKRPRKSQAEGAPPKRKNSRAKGAAGERELANFLKASGFPNAARGQQFKGGGDSPDVTGLKGFHIEAKRTEAGNLYTWLAQAQRDAGVENTPIVIHRRNDKPWVVILELDDFLRCLRKVFA